MRTTETIIRGMHAIAALERTADELRTATFSVFSTSGITRAAGREMLAQAAQQTHEAATLLGQLGFSTTAVDQTTHAAKLLDAGIPGRFPGWKFQEIGYSFGARLVDVRRAESAAVRDAIVDLGARHLTPALSGRAAADIREIGRLAQLSDVADVFPSLGKLDDAAKQSMLSGTLPDSAVDAVESAAARSALMSRPDGLQGAAGELLQRDPTTLQRSDWHQVLAMLDMDHKSDVTHAVRELANEPPLRDVSAAASRGEIAPDKTVRRYFDAWRIGQLTPEQHAHRVDQIMSMDPATLQTEDWFALDQLLTHRFAREGASTPPHSDTVNLRFIASKQLTGRPSSIETARLIFDSWAIRSLTLDEQSARLDVLLSRSSSSLSRADWAEVLALVHHDRGRINTGAPDDIEGIDSLWELARRNAIGESAPAADTQRYLDQWRSFATPEFKQQLAAALNALQDDVADDAARAFIHAHASRLDRVTDALSPAARFDVGIKLLGVSSLAIDRKVAGTLRLIRDSMPAPETLPEEIRPVRDTALDLIDRNLQRIAGLAPEDEPYGYADLQDPVQIGAIRSYAELIEALAGDAGAGAPVAQERLVRW